MYRNLIGCLALLSLCSMQGMAAHPWGLTEGTPQLKSASKLTFGPDGILLVGDTKAAQLVAIDTEDRTKASSVRPVEVADLNAEVARAVDADQVTINDLAVNPISKNIYLAVTVDGEEPAIVRVTGDGTVEKVSIEKVAHAKVALPNPPEDKVTGEGRRRRNLRGDAITDLAYIDGRVLVAGLRQVESPSSVIEFSFPFNENSAAASVEIFHGAHGRSEDYAAIQTFVPMEIDGKPNLVAGYTCTPLVRFPIDQVESNLKVTGTTVAELGNRNRPLDMIAYERDGRRWLLLSNSARGVMKISTDGIGENPGITERVGGGGTAGQSYETVDSLTNVIEMDLYGDDHLVVVTDAEGEGLSLSTVSLP